MDNLEKFIQQHRKEFDTQRPDPKIWEQLSTTLPNPIKTNKVSFVKKIAVAAGVVLLIGFSYVAGQFSANSTKADPQVAELSSLYDQKIEAKVKAISVTTKDTLWKEDLFQLEVVQAELQQELIESPASTKDEIIGAIRENYRIRLKLLNRILNKTAKTYLNTKPTTHERTE